MKTENPKHIIFRIENFTHVENKGRQKSQGGTFLGTPCKSASDLSYKGKISFKIVHRKKIYWCGPLATERTNDELNLRG